MILPYGVRLVLLCLAAFYLAEAAMTAVVAAVARPALRRAERLPASEAARLLLGLRLAPVAVAIFAVAALCAPSYLWLEPDGKVERLGAGCLAAAAFGGALVAAGAGRAALAAIRSMRYLREAAVDGPVLLLAGVLRPRLVVSPSVRKALTAEECEAALRHERAHASSRDNLKRLLLLLTPAPVPGAGAPAELERRWRRMAEWAADDAAAAGSQERAVALASALLRVARLGSAATPALTTSLLADGDELAARVERLLGTPAPISRRRRGAPVAMAAAALIALVPFALPAVHAALERLAR